ncbi:hypothetical protein ACTJKO_05350 [Curtobacterium sp. 22159]|uniref:hypothetical protein n=1 Tax=Curtobacterium sp. 22159 TaxID=3453882 RepID=UPI003F836B76
MSSRLRRQAPAVVLALLAACAVVVALVADHAAWPLAPAFPWHSGDYAYVATTTRWELAQAARTIAWGSAVLAGLLVLASSAAAAARRRRA